MIHYRTFRNSDPPKLAALWRARAAERGLMQPMSADLLDRLVMSKPYFDNEGLTLALDSQEVVGFVHAGFGPNDDETDICYDFGVTAMLMVHPDYRRLGIGTELLARSEQYLRRRGAKVLYGGGIRPLNPFYLGLYGGSELPGVLDSDQQAQRLYRASGYQEIDRAIVLHLDLATFRPPVNRQQIQNRRRATFRVIYDPPTSTWWQACTMGAFERTMFYLVGAADQAVMATASVWQIEPLSTSWGVRAAGLIDFEVDAAHRRSGLAIYLLAEIFRHLQQQGVALIEAQTMQHNSAALALYDKLGFREIDQGVVFRKA